MNMKIYYFFALLYVFIILVPTYWISRAAFSTNESITTLPLIYFPDFTFINFITLFNQIPLFSYILNSIAFSVFSSVIAVSLSFMAAYAFCRFEIKYKKIILWFLLLTIAFPEITTIVPLYSLLKHLSLLDSLVGLCLIMSSLLTPFTVWIFVPFINQIPTELEEASIIDGATILQMFSKIILPVMKPAIGALLLINFINCWNNLLYPLAFCATDDCKTLSVAITEVYGGRTPYGRPWDLMSALGILIFIPILIPIIFSNKTIIQGLTSGSLK